MFIILIAFVTLFCPAQIILPLALAPETPFTPEGKPLKGLIITLDAGHGGFSHQEGYSGSARGVKSRVVEQDLNMLVAAQLRHHLIAAGAKVYMTRWDDRKVTLGNTPRAEELGARTQIARQTASHLFLSLHHNAAGRPAADGVMILIYPKDSAGNDQPLERAFAAILREEIEKKVHHAEPFDAWSNEHPLVFALEVPSACVEFGFLTNPEFDAWVSKRGSHRAEAIGAYNAVVRMWREHRAELEALRKKVYADVIADEDASATQTIASPIESLAASLWVFPHPPQTSKEAQFIIAQYRQRVLSDSTFFLLRAGIEKTPDGWVLRGATNFALFSNTLEAIFKTVGCVPLVNEMEELPSARLGLDCFGVAQIPMAIVWSEPVEDPVGAKGETQLLLGDCVYLLDATPDGAYYHIQGWDGYIGWVRSEAILRMDEKTFSEWADASRAVLIKDYLADVFRLSAGASLPLLSQDNATTAALRLPKGVRATKGKQEVIVPLNVLRLPSQPRAGSIAAQAAAEYLTTPYVFAGKSAIGADCSGLTSVAWAAAGLALPRDARQQVIMGRMVAARWYMPPLQPGDLLFFFDHNTGKIYHVGISIGGKRYLHSSPPEVQVSSYDPADPLYDEFWTKNFAIARRPIP